MQETQFTVLLVDDREENLISLQGILEDDRRRFLKAHSGPEALDLLKANPETGLIILDVQMPGMDGFEVAQAIKRNAATRNIPIIFVTAINKDYEDILTGFDTGAADYLRKPLDIPITRAKVKVFEDLYKHHQSLNFSIEQKNKINEQLRRFMYTVAHDLSSPLNGIMGLIHYSEENEQLQTADEYKELFSEIKRSSTYLSGMIGSILSYSRENDHPNDPELVDTYKLVSQVAYLLFPPANIKINIDEQMPTVRTSRIKLVQVFQNLIGNAIKYNDKKNGEVWIGYEDDGISYRFFVRDNGMGMERKDLEQVFRLFKTVDEGSASTGVGLNVVKMLVEEQGGNIAVDSEPGKGTCFSFKWMK